MAHDVKFRVPDRPLGKVDVEFDVRIDGNMFGTLKISKGAVVWRPANAQYGMKIGWQKLDEFIRNEGKRE